MRFKAVGAIYRKEMRGIFRDRKTVLLIFAMPLLVYPLLITVMLLFMTHVAETAQESVYYMAYDLRSDAFADDTGLDTGPDTGKGASADAGHEGDAKAALLHENTYATARPAVLAELEDALARGPEGFKVVRCGDMAAALAAGEIDAYLTAAGDPPVLRIAYNSASSTSSAAASELEGLLGEFRLEVSRETVERAGLDADAVLRPFEVVFQDAASDAQSLGLLLGTIMPLLLIMGVFLGSMTPAIDVTAGEKERGTQETLMALPLTGREVVCGKFLAVATVGAMSALLYLVTVGLLGAYLLLAVDSFAGFTLDAAFFVPAIAVVIVSVVAFALLLGAVIMCVCTFAKSTKEAESYVSPIMVVLMLVALAGYLDVRLSVELSVVPVLNIVLLIKSVLLGEYNLSAIALVLVSNVAYAAIAIRVLGGLYTSERMLFGEQDGSLVERRGERVVGATPTVGDTVLVAVVAFLAYLYVGSLLQVRLGVLGMGLSQLILLAVPLLAAWYGRVDLRETFSLRAPGVGQVLASVLIAAGAYVLATVVCLPFSQATPSQAQQYQSAMETLFGSVSFLPLLLVVAVAPAVCEEALFRGYLMGAVKGRVRAGSGSRAGAGRDDRDRRRKAAVGIFAVSLVFGLYHMNLYQGFYAFLVGLVLAYVVYKSGSIVCSMLVHFLCNGVSTVITYFPEQAVSVIPALGAGQVTLGELMVAGVVAAAVLAVGIVLLRLCSKGRGGL